MWSFLKPTKYKKTDSYKANCFGFYSINGRSAIDFMEQSRNEGMCIFLDKIRQNNPLGDTTIKLDNFQSNRSLVVRRKAEELLIRLVPPPEDQKIAMNDIFASLENHRAIFWYFYVWMRSLLDTDKVYS
jgi:hypothetical protein